MVPNPNLKKGPKPSRRKNVRGRQKGASRRSQSSDSQAPKGQIANPNALGIIQLDGFARITQDLKDAASTLNLGEPIRGDELGLGWISLETMRMILSKIPTTYEVRGSILENGTPALRLYANSGGRRRVFRKGGIHYESLEEVRSALKGMGENAKISIQIIQRTHMLKYGSKQDVFMRIWKTISDVPEEHRGLAAKTKLNLSVQLDADNRPYLALCTRA
jgi:hypothetical protein